MGCLPQPPTKCSGSRSLSPPHTHVSSLMVVPCQDNVTSLSPVLLDYKILHISSQLQYLQPYLRQLDSFGSLVCQVLSRSPILSVADGYRVHRALFWPCPAPSSKLHLCRVSENGQACHASSALATLGKV